MLCALGVTAVVIGLAAGSAADVGATRRAFLLHLKPMDQGTVRRALDLALAMLESPGCSQVYSDFELPEGGTLQDELDKRGIRPEELLETLVFTDGSREPVCGMGTAALTTKPNTGLIFVCPLFSPLQIREPQRSATLVIHESLHALGLRENPPSSNEITRRVGRRCWKHARRMGPSTP
jgi:hypothetical protein